MSDNFSKWWPCLKKHSKRVDVWLPHMRAARQAVHDRSLRYFTFCALEMIDVFLLVREKLVSVDPDTQRIDGVVFCECEPTFVGVMKELLGAEESGFLGKLEEIVLFEDDEVTVGYPTVNDIIKYFDEFGEGGDERTRERLELKRKFFEFQDFFPFDFFNLDFCDRYYTDPPDVLKIHRAVDRILLWQEREGVLASGDFVRVDRFTMAITCRLDQQLTRQGGERLVQIVESNCKNYPEYVRALGRIQGMSFKKWLIEQPLDFFMSAWPKDLAKMACDRGWDIAIKDHIHYDRLNDKLEPYDMVCLVLEFTRSKKPTTYLSTATRAADVGARKRIDDVAEDSQNGLRLLNDLKSVVRLRNQKARRENRNELPDPGEEILRLRASGVAL